MYRQDKDEIAWRLRFMARFVELGCTVKLARMASQATEYFKDDDPENIADDEMSYMAADSDTGGSDDV